jgi:glycine/D-amino acid oxidase-like deaminating enzyme
MNDRPLSLWHDTLPSAEHIARPRLDIDLDTDVAIVGGGYTGLWTAYYLRKLKPDLSVTVLDANIAGFGASGRNGGWATAELAMGLDKMTALHGADKSKAMFRAMFDTIDEMQTVLTAELINCDFTKGGSLNAASHLVHIERLTAQRDAWRRHGFDENDIRWLNKSEVESRVNANGLLGANFHPHCAAIHPAKLVRGLAHAVERHGATIYENSPVKKILPHQVELDYATVRARFVIRATEGFTQSLHSHRRDLLPLYSYMVATEPLPDEVLRQLGWSGRETFKDARNLIIYAQITADGRIAFGGRGAPYHFGSAVKPEFDRDNTVHEKIVKSMHDLFPMVRDAKITHRWGGPLGVPRNWHSSVNFDPETGLASAGGYVGDGVAASNLAGRCLAHLIIGDGHPLTKLAWVQHRSRRWEVEPFRYIGVNGLLKLSDQMDKHERRTGKPDRIRKKILDFWVG